MSRARHNSKMSNDKSAQSMNGAFAAGGAVYSGSGSNVVKEALEKKKGGSVKKDGYKKGGAVKAKKSYAKGGGVESKMGWPEEGSQVKRSDKRPRKAGGGKVGSDKVPFSSAARPAPNNQTAKP